MKRPSIKRVYDPRRLPDGRIMAGGLQYGVACELREDGSGGQLWDLLRLMDGSRDVDAIMREFGCLHPNADIASAHDTLDQLEAAGLVEDLGAAPPRTLSPAEVKRYAPNTAFFGWVDTGPRRSPLECQAHLKHARVAVLGLGGTGSAVAMSLVAAGVGSLRCLDFDTVESANLTRQLLYGEKDIGSPKVERAVARLRDLNSHVEVSGETLRVTSADDLVEPMHHADLFVLCADQPAELIGLWTNEAALRTCTPWMVCLYSGPTLTTGIFEPHRTPCLACYCGTASEHGEPPPGERLFADPVPNAVVAPTANLSGHLGALEAVYYLAGLRPQTVGRMFHQSLVAYDHVYYIEPEFSADCPACGPNCATLVSALVA